MTNYVQREIDKVMQKFPHCKPELSNYYALLILNLRAESGEEQVHNAWAVFTNTIHPDDEEIIPFNELTPESKKRDVKYAVAFKEFAAEI